MKMNNFKFSLGVLIFTVIVFGLWMYQKKPVELVSDGSTGLRWNKWEIAASPRKYDDSIAHRNFDNTEFQVLVYHDLKTNRWEYAVSPEEMSNYLRKIMNEEINK